MAAVSRGRRARRWQEWVLAGGLVLLVPAFLITACVLADSPPALMTGNAAPPFILKDLVTPPPGLITNWPAAGLDFVVPVEELNGTVPVGFLAFEDYGTATYMYVSSGGCSAAPDGGGIVVDCKISALSAPDRSMCHTITLVAAAFVPGFGLFPGVSGPGAQMLNTCGAGDSGQAPCAFVQWIYDPTGTGACLTYGSGGTGTAPGDASPGDAAGSPRDATGH